MFNFVSLLLIYLFLMFLNSFAGVHYGHDNDGPRLTFAKYYFYHLLILAEFLNFFLYSIYFKSSIYFI